MKVAWTIQLVCGLVALPAACGGSPHPEVSASDASRDPFVGLLSPVKVIRLGKLVIQKTRAGYKLTGLAPDGGMMSVQLARKGDELISPSEPGGGMVYNSKIDRLEMVSAGDQSLEYERTSQSTSIPSPKSAAVASVGSAVELKDAARGIDLRVTVVAAKLRASPYAWPSSRVVRVHLRIKNLSRSAYRDPSFICASSPTSARLPRQLLDGSTDGPISYGPTPLPHTLPESVAIVPNATLDGWLLFEVRDAKHSTPAPDFRTVHQLAFVPASGYSSARSAGGISDRDGRHAGHSPGWVAPCHSRGGPPYRFLQTSSPLSMGTIRASTRSSARARSIMGCNIEARLMALSATSRPPLVMRGMTAW